MIVYWLRKARHAYAGKEKALRAMSFGKWNMGKFKQWLYRTFGGMYGIDYLYYVLSTAALIFAFLAAIIHWAFWIPAAALFGYATFRTFSHDRKRRAAECRAFFGFFKRIGRFFKLQFFRIRDAKTHVYRKCPKCHAVIRLPRAKGKHTVICPRCKERFGVKG